jgi:caa(3)-type oxidase subunit IV
MDHPLQETHEDDALNFSVYLTLLALTGMTLAATLVREGRILAVSIALIVASAKASLIGFYFMDLRRERALMWACVGVALLAVAILLVGILPDVSFFRG